ncbi:cysteine synthase A [Bartonella apihabitans]|nr:cysteine synthase A [Bartonella apihabitans]
MTDKNSSRKGRGIIYSSVLETIGNTPLVRIDAFAKKKGVKANLLAKLEFLILWPVSRTVSALL